MVRADEILAICLEVIVACQLPDHRSPNPVTQDPLRFGPDRLIVLDRQEHVLLRIPQPPGLQGRVVVAYILSLPTKQYVPCGLKLRLGLACSRRICWFCLIVERSKSLSWSRYGAYQGSKTRYEARGSQGGPDRESEAPDIAEMIVDLGLQRAPAGQNHSYSEFLTSASDCCSSLLTSNSPSLSENWICVSSTRNKRGARPWSSRTASSSNCSRASRERPTGMCRSASASRIWRLRRLWNNWSRPSIGRCYSWRRSERNPGSIDLHAVRIAVLKGRGTGP